MAGVFTEDGIPLWLFLTKILKYYKFIFFFFPVLDSLRKSLFSLSYSLFGKKFFGITLFDRFIPLLVSYYCDIDAWIPRHIILATKTNSGLSKVILPTHRIQ